MNEQKGPGVFLCSQCGAPLVRTRRRFVDRLASLIYPQYRYRCAGLSCGWEGNLSVSDVKAQAASAVPKPADSIGGEPVKGTLIKRLP